MALDHELVAADPADVSAHRVQAVGEIGDFRLARRVADDRLAVRKRRRHHQVFGCSDRGEGQSDLRPAQPPARMRADVAIFENDLGAEAGEPVDMQIDRAGTDGAAAGERDGCPPRAGEQRPQHQDGGTHPAHQLVGRRGVGDLAGAEREHAAGIAASSRVAVHADLDAVLGEEVHKGRDIGEVGDVRERQSLVGQEARGHQRQGRVLGAEDLDLAFERAAAPDANTVHEPPLAPGAWRRRAAARARRGRPVRFRRRTIGERRRRDKLPLRPAGTLPWRRGARWRGSGRRSCAR